jgi:hypothetical protein
LKFSAASSQDRNRTVLTAHGVGLAAIAADLRSAPAAAALRRVDVSNNSLTSLGGLLALGPRLDTAHAQSLVENPCSQYLTGMSHIMNPRVSERKKHCQRPQSAHSRSQKRTHAHTCTHARTSHARTHTHARIHARTHAYTHTHARLRARARARTHTHTHRRADLAARVGQRARGPGDASRPAGRGARGPRPE